MEEFMQKLREIEHMAQVLPLELFRLCSTICRKLRENDLDYICCEEDGELIFTVFYEEARKNAHDVTFGIHPNGRFRAVGNEWELGHGKAASMLVFLGGISEFASLKRVDPFDDDTNLFIAFSAQIDTLLQTPDIAADFCLTMAEKVAGESYDTDQAIFELLNPPHNRKEN